MKTMHKTVTFLLGGFLALAPSVVQAIDIVTEKTQLPPGTCQSFTFYQPLNLFKDATLYLSDLGGVGNRKENQKGWSHLNQESPVQTVLKGDVQLVQLGPPRPFKNFGAIARIYEAAEPRLKWSENETRAPHGRLPKQSTAQVIPVQICGTDAYNSALGFVLADDFQKAQLYDTRSASLPPSVYPNPVPAFPQTGNGR